jgi:tetratricopeptide (TPR) repeat protein
MRRVKLLLVALALLVTASTALEAQNWRGRGRLSGYVHNEKGEPIADAKVTPTFQGQGPAPVTTDKKGHWAVLGLASGDWNIVIDAEGYNGTEGVMHVSEGAVGPGEVLHAVLKLPEPAKRAEPGVNEWLAEGNALFQQEKYAEARALFEKSLAAVEDVNKAPILRGIAGAYFKEGNSEKAVESLEQSLVYAPGDVETLRSLIGILEQQHKRAEADKYIAMLPAGEKVEPTILINRGIELYNKQVYPEALAIFSQVASENPEMADAYYYRGLVYLAQNQSDPAKTDFKKALELEPEGARASEIKEYLKYLDPDAKP